MLAERLPPAAGEVLATPAMEARQRINLDWLIRLRWGAVIGQSVTILAVAVFLDVSLPMYPLLLVLLATVVSNVLLARWARQARRIREALLCVLVMLDIVLLTAMLYYTGGSTNPFNFLYLVHIALAAVTLRPAHIAALLALASLCFGALFWWYVPLSVARTGSLPLRLHGQGMAVAFILAAGFIVYFVHRVTRALASLEAKLAQAREARARAERLSSLATLAAGAAHELATPLGTIAVVAKELERHVARLQNTQTAATASVEPAALWRSLHDDAVLIRQEVERCRGVLTHMATNAGAPAGEPMTLLSTTQLLQDTLAELPQAAQIDVCWTAQARQAWLHIPVRSVAQALRCVLKNACEATQQQAPQQQTPVRLWLAIHQQNFIITVQDPGVGIPAEVLAHVGEPFLPPKRQGQAWDWVCF